VWRLYIATPRPEGAMMVVSPEASDWTRTTSVVGMVIAQTISAMQALAFANAMLS